VSQFGIGPFVITLYEITILLGTILKNNRILSTILLMQGRQNFLDREGGLSYPQPGRGRRFKDNNQSEKLEEIMEAKPYIRYPKPYQAGAAGEVSGTPFINEPGQVSYGVNDFKPGLFRALHGHHTWELLLVDSSSEGPGYVYFDGRWWRVPPGAAVFVPKGSPTPGHPATPPDSG
jgi:quercetin dioxygenase-like cupin family protein